MATGTETPSDLGASGIVISVDAMGSDRGPGAVVAGLVLSAVALPDAHFILHGDEAQLAPLLAREQALAARVTLRHAPRVVTMQDKPSQVMRHGMGTSMCPAIDSVKELSLIHIWVCLRDSSHGFHRWARRQRTRPKAPLPS